MATENAGSTSAAERGRALVEAVSRHDLDALRAEWDADIVEDFVALGQEVRGPQALAAFMAELFAAVPDLHLEIEDVFSERDKAVVGWRLTGTFSGGPFQGIHATGRPLDFRGVDVMRFVGEKLSRNTIYYDGATFARQIGMLPAQGSGGDRTMTSAFNAVTAVRQRLRRG